MMKIYPDILGGANRTAPGLKHTQYTVESGLKKCNRAILRPASVVHIGNRLKICHCFLMS